MGACGLKRCSQAKGASPCRMLFLMEMVGYGVCWLQCCSPAKGASPCADFLDKGFEEISFG